MFTTRMGPSQPYFIAQKIKQNQTELLERGAELGHLSGEILRDRAGAGRRHVENPVAALAHRVQPELPQLRRRERILLELLAQDLAPRLLEDVSRRLRAGWGFGFGFRVRVRVRV